MKYTIHNICHRPHDLDDSHIYFQFDIQFTEPENLVMSYHQDYNSLSFYIQSDHPDYYAYLQKVREGIDGWGPCEDKLFDTLGEEELKQVYDYLEEYLLQVEWMPRLFEQQKEIRSMTGTKRIELQEGAEKVVKELSKGATIMKSEQRRYLTFCETVEKQIRQTAAEVYPELVDGDMEQLKEFKYLFVRDIQAIHDKIEKMRVKYNKG
jgi:hypothetical protein